MPTNWQDTSEIVAGEVLNRRINPAVIPPGALMPPYDAIVAQFAAGRDLTDLISTIGQASIQAAFEASAHLNRDMPVDWTKLLLLAANRAAAARALSKEVRRLENGEDYSLNNIQKALELLDREAPVYRTAAEIEPMVGIWQPTYYAPLDRHLGDPQDLDQPGGFPAASLVVVGAPPGTGKTSFGTKIAGTFAKAGRKSAFYTLEMLDGQLVHRLIQTGDLSVEERKRIYVIAGKKTADEVYADASRLKAIDPELGLVFIDFADLMIKGQEDEQAMAYVYRRTAELAEEIATPVVLLSQLSRSTYTGGIPKINHLRYSGLAEALGGLILLLYNPRQIFVQMATDDRLPLVGGRGYIIVGKSRFGFREGGVGAIAVDWDGRTAWGEESYGWYPLQ